jgi:type VI secretion system secreted protein VgrG
VQPNDEYAATLDGVDDRLVLHWATIREKLSRVPEYDLELYSTAADLDISTLLGTPVDICVARNDGSVRFFYGIFVRIRQVGVEDNYRILRAVVAPKLWLAQQTRECRIFPPTTIPI